MNKEIEAIEGSCFNIDKLFDKDCIKKKTNKPYYLQNKN